MKNLCAGIDFGTTNTVAAVGCSDKDCQIIPTEENFTDLPSAIFFAEKNNQISVGRSAMQKYMNGDAGRFMRSLKRILGTSAMKFGTVINGFPTSFESVIGQFIKTVKDKLDNVSEQVIENVVMGRPVHFCVDDIDGDKRAEIELKQIARNAGFKNILFQFEPIAAAFAHERKLDVEQLAAVIDIGGGTSDFTIIKIGGDLKNKSDRSDDILSNTGIRIGGNDFDKDLSINSFMPQFGMGTLYNSGTINNPKLLPVPNGPYFDLSEWSRINFLYNYKSINDIKKYLQGAVEPEKYSRLINIVEAEQGHKLLDIIENTKIKLSDNEVVNSVLHFINGQPILKTNRQEFEESIKIDTDKICNAAKECIKLAGVNAIDIQLIILTGGSTEIPFVRDTLCKIFPNAKVSGENKLSSVGLGLTFDAIRRFLC